jgi:hypothetical protein
MYPRDSSNALNVFDRLVFNSFGCATPPGPGMRPASAQLISREVLPFYASLAALAAGTLLIDAVLHLLNVVWIGRYLGIAGTLIIIGSFGYSLRKRKLITTGNPVTLLRTHERMAGSDQAGTVHLVHLHEHVGRSEPVIQQQAVVAGGEQPRIAGQFAGDRWPRQPRR